ncbi:MAG: LCP family protein [Nitriliruptoraceae bacterium]
MAESPGAGAPARPRRSERRSDRRGRREGSSGAAGRRAARRDAARRRRRFRLVTVLGALLAVGAALVGLVAGGVVDRDLLAGGWPAWLRPGTTADPATDADDPAATADQEHSVLLSTVDADGALRWLALLAVPADGDATTVLLVPPALVADVPGHGTFTLADAGELGGTELVAASLANLLELRLDAAVSTDVDGWGQLVDAAGGVQVTLRVGVDDAARGVRLEPGPQRLDGQATVAVLDAAGPPLGQLEALARVPPVFAGLLDAIADDPDLPGRLLDLGDDAGPVLGTDAPEVVAEVLGSLADARPRDELAVLTLPVVPVGDGPEVGFRLDDERAGSLLADRLGPWRPDAALATGRDVQILNGNGIPRIGQRVSELLADGGYRVVLSGNADRFTHETTRIILHADTREQIAVGQDLQRRLGVGDLELAATPSSVVDVTIVVGRDFPPDEDEGS